MIERSIVNVIYETVNWNLVWDELGVPDDFDVSLDAVF